MTVQNCVSPQPHETAEVFLRTSQDPRLNYSFASAVSDLTVVGTIYQLGADLARWHRCSRAIAGFQHPALDTTKFTAPFHGEKTAIKIATLARIAYVSALTLLATQKSGGSLFTAGAALALTAGATFMFRAGLASDSLHYETLQTLRQQNLTTQTALVTR